MNIRGNTKSKKENLVKNYNYDLLADFQNILNKWKNWYSQLLNVYQ
jgi:hypothetical protein